jgi:hypothetical protein
MPAVSISRDLAGLLSRRERDDGAPAGRRGVAPKPAPEHPVVRPVENEVLSALAGEIQCQAFATQGPRHRHSLLTGGCAGPVVAHPIAAAGNAGPSLGELQVVPHPVRGGVWCR